MMRGLAVVALAILCAPRAYAEPPPCSAQGMTLPSAANVHTASDYPVLSTVLPEEGSTIVAFVVGTDGRTSAPAVIRSSGSLRLDDASKDAVKGWLYKPALSGGAPTACLLIAEVRWLIPDAAKAAKKDL